MVHTSNNISTRTRLPTFVLCLVKTVKSLLIMIIYAFYVIIVFIIIFIIITYCCYVGILYIYIIINARGLHRPEQINHWFGHGLCTLTDRVSYVCDPGATNTKSIILFRAR